MEIMKGGLFMLAALVASKMEPPQKSKFIDYTPELRKKRKYNKSSNTGKDELIEKAFIAGRSQTSWEQFKKDNQLT